MRKSDEEVANMLPRSVEVVIGDVGDPVTLNAAVEGCSKIIYCATARSAITGDLFRVDHRGVYNLTKAFQVRPHPAFFSITSMDILHDSYKGSFSRVFQLCRVLLEIWVCAQTIRHSILVHVHHDAFHQETGLPVVLDTSIVCIVSVVMCTMLPVCSGHI